MDLDLFTPIKDFKPILRKNTIVLEEGIAQFYIVLAFWNGENWIDTETKTMCLPSHVLDLSKLTTKEKAETCIEEATKETYENCEWYREVDEVTKKWKDKL